MTHANAPLTPTGRLRMVQRHLHDGIPQAHVAAEFRVSRPTVATWVARYRAEGEAGLQDLPSSIRSWSPRSTPCGGSASGPHGASITTSPPKATSCACAPWGGGCTDSGSPAYGT